MTKNVKIVIKRTMTTITQVAYCNMCRQEAMPPYCEAATGYEGGGQAITTTIVAAGKVLQTVEATVCSIGCYNAHNLTLQESLAHWGFVPCG